MLHLEYAYCLENTAVDEQQVDTVLESKLEQQFPIPPLL